MENHRKNKKKRYKKLYWLLAGLLIVIFVLVLLLHKPARYNPPIPVKDKQVSPYLTHELLPKLYNGTQRQKPFDLIITQKGVNDIIARSDWPKESEGVRFSAPVAIFVPERIILMGTAAMHGVELVVTVELNPVLDQQGLLNLQVAKVKVGAMNVTPLAGPMARRMYMRQRAATDIDANNIKVQIAASLLDDKPFVPVFDIDDKKVRIDKIAVTDGKISVHLIPAGD